MLPITEVEPNGRKRGRRRRGRGRARHGAAPARDTVVVLHGAWPVAGRQGRELLVWAETSGSRPRRGGDGSHPYSLSQRELVQLLGELAVSSPALGPMTELSRLRATLALPSGGDLPLPSLHALRDDAGAPAAEEWRLARWRIEGIGLSPEHLASLLPYLPEERFPARANVIVGDDLRFWRLASMMLVELLVRERYLPRFIPDPAVNDGRFHVVWRPFLDRHDTERVRQLAHAMPPAALADRSADGISSTESGVETFLTEALDALVRLHGRRSINIDTLPKRRREREPNILRSALMEREAVTGIRPDLVELRAKLDGWVSTLARVSGDMVSMCLKLDPPGPEPGGAPPRPDEPWRLGFHLQAVDEPSLLLPASVIWSQSGSEIVYQGQRFLEPQEKLLAGLGRAARLFPPLEASLSEATPSECLLPPGLAYHFLTEVSPVLSDAGLVVISPDFSKAQLGVRMRLRPSDDVKDTDGTGGLGLGTIVRYDLAIALGDQTLSPNEIESSFDSRCRSSRWAARGRCSRATTSTRPSPSRAARTRGRSRSRRRCARRWAAAS
ncbi:MAG: SNF2 helicase-associated domain-containing protein [Acidobacteriota bacterium]